MKYFEQQGEAMVINLKMLQRWRESQRRKDNLWKSRLGSPF